MIRARPRGVSLAFMGALERMVERPTRPDNRRGRFRARRRRLAAEAGRTYKRNRARVRAGKQEGRQAGRL